MNYVPTAESERDPQPIPCAAAPILDLALCLILSVTVVGLLSRTPCRKCLCCRGGIGATRRHFVSVPPVIQGGRFLSSEASGLSVLISLQPASGQSMIRSQVSVILLLSKR